MSRQDKQTNYIEIAEVVAKRSHDVETKVGAILVKNDTGAIIATGFNGFVRGAPDDKLPNTRPDKYQYMQHAEINLIAHCARHGISMDNTTVYCTLSPCLSCMRTLWQCGISSVVAKEAYKDIKDILNAKDINVTLSHKDGLIFLNYEAKK